MWLSAIKLAMSTGSKIYANRQRTKQAMSDAQLRARELDLQAQENERKEKEGQERLNLDRMRAMMSDQNQDEKLQQNEELAKLRADTSIQKTILGKTIPSGDKMTKSVSIIRGEN